MVTLQFEHQLTYRELPPYYNNLYPAIPIRISGPSGTDDALVVVDSGAEYTLLNGERCQGLGIDLPSGEKIRLSGLAGGLLSYVHPVTLLIEGISIQARVAFSTSTIGRELLGRHSVFQHLRLGFRERYSHIYLSADQ